MQIVLATRNQHKKQELVALLRGLDITIRTLDDFPPHRRLSKTATRCRS